MILFSLLMDQPVNKTHKENVDFLPRLRSSRYRQTPYTLYPSKSPRHLREHPCFYSCVFSEFWRNFDEQELSGRFYLCRFYLLFAMSPYAIVLRLHIIIYIIEPRSHQD